MSYPNDQGNPAAAVPVYMGQPSGGTTVTNASGTITTGGTAQTVFAANLSRRFLLIQNPSAATESLWVGLGSSAVIGSSIELTAGQSFPPPGSNFVPTQSISLNATTTGHAFIAYQG